MRDKLPAPVNAIIDDYVNRLTSIHQGLVEGIYLTGSVPLGDYYSRKSDIDFITILRDSPSKDLIKLLEIIHRNIERSHNHSKLNGYYLTLDGIRNDQKTYPSFFRNKMHVARP